MQLVCGRSSLLSLFYSQHLKIHQTNIDNQLSAFIKHSSQAER